MKHKLISVALIAVLLFMVLGNSTACGPTTTQYDLTITSTTGGDVTTPVEGTHTYTTGTAVNLTATPDAGYQFVNWTGDVGTIADGNDATTTITMSGDYSITANFALGAVSYDLTTSSTAGGNVTTPGEGTFSYNASNVVNLVATPDANYRFVNWTGDVGTIANVNAATTTITMNDDYTITAHFALNMTFIDNVPDTNQPPTQTLPSTNPKTNYCAPIAMVNILEYWDDVMNHANAQNVTAGLAANTTAEYLGYFMDTNNKGSPARANVGQLGTLDVDIDPGTVEFVRWDAAHPPVPAPPFVLPAGKLGYTWTVTRNCTADYNASVAFYTAEIDAGRPLVVSFSYWNPVSPQTPLSYYDPETGETIDVCAWGEDTGGSSNPDHQEYWSPDIGHTVTGVGYIFAWAPDGSGPYFFVIVHDNWLDTPENIAIQWNHWKCLFAVNPGS